MTQYPADLVRTLTSRIQRTCTCRVECAHCTVFEGGGPKLRWYYGPLGTEVSIRGVLVGRIGSSMTCRNPRCVRPSHCRGGTEYRIELEGRLNIILRERFGMGLD